MNHPLRIRGARLARVAFLLLLPACATNQGDWVIPASAASSNGVLLHIVGTVEHSELEGGFFLIRSEDGTAYDPTNLPEEFQQSGLPVEAEGRRRNDMAGTHMTGTIIQLVRIRKR